MKKTTLAVSATLTAAALLALAAPTAASAHVSLDTDTAEAGGYALLTVKVPNESATAATTTVELHLPADTPFASVSYVPTPGWTTELVRETLPEPVTVGESEITEAVTSVIFTADDAGISDGQLQLFRISVGPVPDVDSVAIAATQTYDDGTVVEWNGEGDEPAPVLYVNAEPEGDHHGAEAEAEGEHEEAASPASGDTLARVLGIGGLVVGAVGIVTAITARRRSTDESAQ